MSSSPPQYTCEITSHRATNVPLADLNDLSSDPYIVATLAPLQHVIGSSGPAPRAQQIVSFRTSTARKTLNPVFDERWVVSGIPASGFVLILELLDEDRGNHDDKLGKAVIRFPDPNFAGEDGGELKEGFKVEEREYKVHKRHGSLRTRVGTYVAKTITRGRIRHRVRVVLSVRVLGPAPRLEGENAGRIYTLGPHVFVRHFSPLATRLTSVQSFKANRLQLTGPVPSALRHRYVGFAPFVKAMFRARGIEGIILNRALHKQHRAIYKWDKNTVWGVIEESSEDRETAGKEEHNTGDERPNEAFAKKFLEMAEYGTEGRMFTYVIMLDGQMRFTETGEEFAIGLLSKHTMHSDVSIEIAYSGEFFVRRVRKSRRAAQTQNSNGHANGHAPKPHCVEEDSHGEAETPGGESNRSSDLPPSAYELVIDNDSGTYRPRKDLLPVLSEFLSRPSNLGALGRIRAMDGFDERLKRWKERRKEEKQRARGAAGAARGKGIVRQASVSSSGSSTSSSGEEEAQVAVAEDAAMERRKVSGQEKGEQKVLQEDARRAEENKDDDDAAKEEERDAAAEHP